jgi:hypothetical protein
MGAESVFLEGVGEVKVLPQTRQRVAFSLNRVPQVGHTLVAEGLDSVIGSLFWVFHEPKLYHTALDPLFLFIKGGV